MSYCLDISNPNALKIAKINNYNYITVEECDRKSPSKLDTTSENKLLIFNEYLKRIKKLKPTQIHMYNEAFKANKKLDDNTYLEGLEYVQDSLKKMMIFNKNVKLIPILPKNHWIIYVSGLSGSGKSYYIANLITNNFPPSQLVYLFSPVKEDKAFKDLNILHVDLETFEEDFGIPFDIEFIAGKESSPNIAIFDDIHTFHNRQTRDMYLDIQKQLLERGRHLHVRSINVSHNPLDREITKTALRESEYYVVFPSTNYRDTKALLTTYTGLTKEQVDDVLELDTRGVIIKKSVPSYYVSDHVVRLLGK